MADQAARPGGIAGESCVGLGIYVLQDPLLHTWAFRRVLGGWLEAVCRGASRYRGEGQDVSGLGQAGPGLGALSGGKGGRAPADGGDPQAARDQIKMNFPPL